jgi:hypothetical protein
MNEFLSPERMALTIPIIGIIGLCTLPIVVFVLRYLRRRRLFELYHEERMAAIEKGVDVPPLPEALLVESGRRKPLRPGETLLKGLVWLFVGVGVVLVLQAESPRHLSIGLIPVGVGLAYLIYYWVEGRKIPAIIQGTPTDPSSPISAPTQV